MVFFLRSGKSWLPSLKEMSCDIFGESLTYPRSFAIIGYKKNTGVVEDMAALARKAYKYVKDVLKETRFGSEFKFSSHVISYGKGYPRPIKVSASCRYGAGLVPGFDAASKSISSWAGAGIGTAESFVVSSTFGLVSSIENTYELYNTNLPPLRTNIHVLPTKVDAIAKIEARFGDSSLFRDFVVAAEDANIKKDSDVEGTLAQMFSSYRAKRAVIGLLSQITKIIFNLLCLFAEVMLSRFLVSTGVFLLVLGYTGYILKTAKEPASTDSHTISIKLKLLQRNLKKKRGLLVLMGEEKKEIIKSEKLVRQVRWLVEKGQNAVITTASREEKEAFFAEVRSAPEHLVPRWIQVLSEAYHSNDGTKKEDALNRLSCIDNLDEHASGVMARIKKHHGVGNVIMREAVRFLKETFLESWGPGGMIVATVIYTALTLIGVGMPWLPIALVLLMVAAKPLIKKINQRFTELLLSIYMSGFMRPVRRALPILDKMIGIQVVNKFDCHPGSSEEYDKNKHFLQACLVSEGKGVADKNKLDSSKFLGPDTVAKGMITIPAA